MWQGLSGWGEIRTKKIISQKSEIDEQLYAGQKTRSEDFEALKIGKVRSGSLVLR